MEGPKEKKENEFWWIDVDTAVLKRCGGEFGGCIEGFR